MILHAGLVAMLDNEAWKGLLITGPSGSGKSDLALRLMDRSGMALVADDRTLVWASGGKLYGRSPETLAGRIESRGYGVLTAGLRDHVEIVMIVDLDPENTVERMPDGETRDVLGLDVPLIRQRGFEASGPAKIRRWLMALG